MAKGKITQRQLLVLAFVCLCSPIIRLLPTASVKYAGSGAWVSIFVAAVPSLLYVYMLCDFMGNRIEGESSADMMIRCLGRPLGKTVCTIFLIWFLFYGGFILRTSSERLLSTIFDNGSLFVISTVTVATALIPAVGSVKSLARTGELMFLVIAGALWFILFFALDDIELEYLLPVTTRDSGGILLGAVAVFDIVSAIFYVTFLAGNAKKSTKEKKTGLRWCIYVLLAMFGIVFCTLGAISAPLVNKMQSPFFIMIRNISAFGVIEKIESVIIAIWVFTDFLFLATLMKITGVLTKKVAGVETGKLYYAAIALIVFIISFIITPTIFDMEFISQTLVPAVNLSLSAGLFLIVYIVWKIRSKKVVQDIGKE